MVGGSACVPWWSEVEVPCLLRLLRWPALRSCSESGSGLGAWFGFGFGFGFRFRLGLGFGFGLG